VLAVALFLWLLCFFVFLNVWTRPHVNEGARPKAKSSPLLGSQVVITSKTKIDGDAMMWMQVYKGEWVQDINAEFVSGRVVVKSYKP
jgi:hypothetical protein